MKYFTKSKANHFIVNTSKVLDIVVAIILIAAIIIGIVPIVLDISHLYINAGKGIDFKVILDKLFTIVIGVEFLKMLCRHDIDSVIEVVLFTLARKMIVEHGTAADNLMTVLAIALLFVVRKYLFVKQLDKHIE